MLALAIIIAALAAAPPVQSCSRVDPLRRIAQAASAAELHPLKPSDTSPYVEQLTFSARDYDLDPTNKTAAADLLGRLPTTDDVPLFPGGRADLDCWLTDPFTPLRRLYDRMPEIAERAVTIGGGPLKPYLRYLLNENNPSAAAASARLCRADPERFAAELAALDAQTRRTFVDRLVEPTRCEAKQ